eukprot:364735-Chlamydomonas_euryale.AAC.9
MQGAALGGQQVGVVTQRAPRQPHAGSTQMIAVECEGCVMGSEGCGVCGAVWWHCHKTGK